jgi:hypothetical protein
MARTSGVDRGEGVGRRAAVAGRVDALHLEGVGAVSQSDVDLWRGARGQGGAVQRAPPYLVQVS